MRKNDVTIAILYYHVDDFLICAKESLIKEITDKLNKKFKLYRLGFPEEILGINVSMDSEGVFLYMEDKITDLLQIYELLEAHSLTTPLPANISLPDRNEIQDLCVIENYQSLVGSLLYIARCVRFDISFGVNLLSRYSNKHNVKLWRLLKGILRYLKGTKDLKLKYKFHDMNNGKVLSDWCDASFANTPTRKSTYGYLIMWNDSLISWNSSVLKSVVTSTTEAEYMAATISMKQCLFVKNFIEEILGHNIEINLYTDNQPCIGWLTNSNSQHRKVKHIDVNYRFIEQLVKEKKNSSKRCSK